MEQNKIWDYNWNNKKKVLPPTLFARRTFKLIKNKKFDSLLDLGCGDGKDSVYFAEKMLNVTSIDFSKVAISMLEKKIKKKGLKNIKTIVLDMNKINLKLEKYDLIYANLSLHYFKNKETKILFKNLYNILNKDGLIFIRCKSTKNTSDKKGTEIEKDFYMYKNKFYKLFTKEYMINLMKNFKLIKIRNTSSKQLRMDGSITTSFFIECIAKK